MIKFLLFLLICNQIYSEDQSFIKLKGHSKADKTLANYSKKNCLDNLTSKQYNWLIKKSKKVSVFKEGDTLLLSYFIKAKNGKNLNFISTAVKSSEKFFTSMQLTEIDCKKNILFIDETGYEGGSTTMVDLLNGEKIQYMHNISFSPNNRYFLRNLNQQYSDQAGIDLWSCKERSMTSSCKKKWSDSSLYGGLKDVVWKQKQLSFLSSREYEPKDTQFNLKVNCVLEPKTNCLVTNIKTNESK